MTETEPDTGSVDTAAERAADLALAERCRRIGSVVDEAQGWVEANRRRVGGEAAALSRELTRTSTEAGRLARAAERPMCVGVFGPSQSGKSYLISALARAGDRPLIADFGGEKRDFLKDINPEGGRESTGLVTRFSLRRMETPSGRPVALRLLSETDLVKILGNSFYADCDHSDSEDPTPEAIAAELDRLEAGARSSSGPLDGLAVLDLQEYFEQRFRGHGRIRALRNGYWPRAAALAGRLDIDGRARLFQLIWGGAAGFTDLYRHLVGALDRLGRPETAYCGLDALTPRAQSIIDVQALNGLAGADTGEIEAAGPDGRTARLGRADLAALTAELSITIGERPWAFFDHTDLLDFPGARSRETIRDLEGFLTEGGLATLFLRGKVAYLFERYATERELTAMLLCIGPGNLEVKGLPELVEDWIAGTHGARPEDRARIATALFLVLTKFDLEFEEKKGADASPESRWSIRLFASLLDPFGKQHDWPTDWDGRGPFRNSFWLRNPNLKQKALFDYDGDREIAVRRGEDEFVARMRAGFLGNEDVTRHFAEPEAAWEAALALNDGGVTYLARALAPLCRPGLKRQQIAQRLARLTARLGERLRPFHVSGDLEAERAAKKAMAEGLARSLVAIAGRQQFGHLVESLQIGEEALLNAAYVARFMPSSESVGNGVPAPSIGTRVDEDEMLSALGLGGDDEVAAGEIKPAAPADFAAHFAMTALAHWADRLYERAASAAIRDGLKVEPGTFQSLVHEIIRGAGRLDIGGRLAERLRQAGGALGVRADRLAAKQASLAAAEINAHATWLGFPPHCEDAAGSEDRPVVGDKPIFQRSEPAAGLPVLGEKPARYDQRYYVDWIAAWMRLVDDNVTGGAADGIDPAENERLNRIIGILGEEREAAAHGSEAAG